MSIPPSNNVPPYGTPPGGYYPSRPAKPSGGGNGWKIAGFGCLGLFLLLAIGGVILVRNVKNSFSHPSKGSFVGIMALAGQATFDGVRLQQAIVKYHTQHNAYPKSLMDLYADGSIDGKLLHNNLDDSDDPAHPSWRYVPPAEGAPGNTPILEEPYHLTLGNTTTPGKIIIDLDGKSQSAASRQDSSGSQNSPDGSQNSPDGGQGGGTQ